MIRLSITILVMMGLSACGPTEDPAPTAAEGAEYLGLNSGKTFTYQSSVGQDEKHTYTLQSDGASRVFGWVATAGGFVNPDRSGTIEITAEGAFLNRLDDCVTTCGVATPPIHLFDWPIKDKSRKSTETTVQWSQNGVDGESTVETHAFQVSGMTTVDVPAGTYDGLEIFWTRTRDQENVTARWVIVPGVGWVIREAFDGTTLELKE